MEYKIPNCLVVGKKWTLKNKVFMVSFLENGNKVIIPCFSLADLQYISDQANGLGVKITGLELVQR